MQGNNPHLLVKGALVGLLLLGACAPPAIEEWSEADFLAVMETIRHTRDSTIADMAFRFNTDTALAAVIIDAARWEGLDLDLAFRLVQVESRFDSTAVSPAGALGLAQVMPATARFRNADPDRLMEARYNLHVGFAYLIDLLQVYQGDFHLALTHYNGGTRAVHLLDNGYDITRGYSGRVCGGPCGDIQ